MNNNDDRRERFDEFAKFVGVTPAFLYEGLTTFNKAENGLPKLSDKTIQNMRNFGISFRNKATTDFLMAFLRANFPGQEDLPDRVAAKYLANVAPQVSQEASALPKAILDSDPELVRSISQLLAFGSANPYLHGVRNAYADHYYLVRKTSRPKTNIYYEEPFRIGDRGEPSYLIPNDQGLNTGFSFASNGICTSVLFHEHHTRILGVRVIMLFGNANPDKDAMTGVMLRFSDDQARPVASQVLARRLPMDVSSNPWDSVVKQLTSDEVSELSSDAIQELNRVAADLTHKVHAQDDPNELFAVYEAFELKNHAKAFDGKEYDKALERANLDEATFRRRLGR